MLFLRKYRRHRLLADPFPKGWLYYLSRNVGFYELLSDAERFKLQDDLRILISEKHWEGCGGLTITDEIRVTIAAQAGLLLLGMKHDYFKRVISILVYPTAYWAPEQSMGPDGVVNEGYSDRDGESWHHGVVVFGWDAVLDDARNRRDGHNVVLHEFAHQLDFVDGLTDGAPLHGRHDARGGWHEVMHDEYHRLIRESEKGSRTLFDRYGATSPSEFFAVATECFFERPAPMQRRHPQLYGLFRDYYGQDPAKRFSEQRKHG